MNAAIARQVGHTKYIFTVILREKYSVVKCLVMRVTRNNATTIAILKDCTLPVTTGFTSTESKKQIMLL